jgi:hypothetical protein
MVFVGCSGNPVRCKKEIGTGYGRRALFQPGGVVGLPRAASEFREARPGAIIGPLPSCNATNATYFCLT